MAVIVSGCNRKVYDIFKRKKRIISANGLNVENRSELRQLLTIIRDYLITIRNVSVIGPDVNTGVQIAETFENIHKICSLFLF